MDYSKYQAIDFIKDESFQEWCLHPEGEHAHFWENWASQHPDQQGEIHKAKQLLAAFQGLGEELSDSKIDLMWSTIQHRTQETTVITLPKTRQSTIRRWSRIAALWAGVIMAISIGIYWLANQTTTVSFTTAYGEVKSIALPDGSRVVLNGNSTLNYQEKDFDAATRVVSLVGEAHFSVIHTPDHQRFLIQTADEMGVEVLGTKFTMTNRPMKKQVVLEEGKVKVSNTAAFNEVDHDAVYMQPGELIVWDAQKSAWHKEQVEEPSRYGSFRDHRLIFKKTPLQEVARILEDNYGYRVVFDDPTLAGKHFTGSCAANEISLLLRSIGKAFGVNVQEQDQHVTIGNTN
ncbi:FecR family protein [Parapedobacter koreensis]|uniref:FecR family protein n=1 Tax=Parapedobacter koreensis TaxID=332977 RepID=A0A1H7S0Q2_9SPHI|nr:FecR domain-containing protein [Parapedobacter koreensis]SEL66045.1 FecR family protein [Parapedobacter koreensis]